VNELGSQPIIFIVYLC